MTKREEANTSKPSVWEKIPGNSITLLFGGSGCSTFVLDGDGFHISYNPGTDCGEETALCKDGRYFILLGDFRDGYERIVQDGYEACLQYFKQHNAEVSPWSDDLDEAAA